MTRMEASHTCSKTRRLTKLLLRRPFRTTFKTIMPLSLTLRKSRACTQGPSQSLCRHLSQRRQRSLKAVKCSHQASVTRLCRARAASLRLMQLNLDRGNSPNRHLRFLGSFRMSMSLGEAINCCRLLQLCPLRSERQELSNMCKSWLRMII